MSDKQAIYANTPKGKIFTGNLTADGTYEQKVNRTHYMRYGNSKGIDVPIYELLLRCGCKWWRVADRNNVAPVLKMPFSKIAVLLQAGIAKKIKYPGYDEQIQIPLEHFNTTPYQGQVKMGL